MAKLYWPRETKKATTGTATGHFVNKTEKWTMVQNRKIDGARPSMPVYLVQLRALMVPCLSRKFPVQITVFVGNTDKRLAYHFLLCKVRPCFPYCYEIDFTAVAFKVLPNV